MTDSLGSSIVLSVAPTIAALATLIATVFVGFKANKKADSIHTLVNSNLSRVQADLKLALERVDKLEALLKTMSVSDSGPD